jgi:hypothetical protein
MTVVTRHRMDHNGDRRRGQHSPEPASITNSPTTPVPGIGIAVPVFAPVATAARLVIQYKSGPNPHTR